LTVISFDDDDLSAAPSEVTIPSSDGVLPSGGGAPVAAIDPDLVTLAGIGQRYSKIRFDLLDSIGSVIGIVHPDADRTPAIDVRTDATLKRVLRNLWVTPSEAIDIDLAADRVRPIWVFSDGSEWPLGTFIFADASTAWQSWGKPLTGSLVDHLLVLNQPSDVSVVSYPSGTNIADALEAEWRRSGLAEYRVEPCGTFLADALSWPIETKQLTRMIDLSKLGGFLDPYVDNYGVGQSRAVPALTAETTDLVYDDNRDVGRVYADTTVESEDLLRAPNRFMVVSTSGSAAPVVAFADVPASAPQSWARRGFRVVEVIRVNGVASVADAQVIADAAVASSGHTFRYAEFDSAPDPRHDVYDIVRWMGENFLELGWSLPLAEGSSHHHRLRKSDA
jgi:hypothetical protein